MRFKLIVGLCVWLPALVAAGDGADDKAIAKATKTLEGTWVLDEFEIDSIRGLSKGKGADRKDNRRTYRKDGTYKTEVGGRVGQEGTWKIVAVKEKVFHLDEANKQNRIFRAILEIVNEDTVRICFAGPGAEKRPTKFEAPPGSNHWLLTYKRLKE